MTSPALYARSSLSMDFTGMHEETALLPFSGAGLFPAMTDSAIRTAAMMTAAQRMASHEFRILAKVGRRHDIRTRHHIGSRHISLTLECVIGGGLVDKRFLVINKAHL